MAIGGVGIGSIGDGLVGVGKIGIGSIGIEQNPQEDDLVPTPYPPAGAQYWLSTSITNAAVSTGASYRNIIIDGCIESSVWIANGLYNLVCFNPSLHVGGGVQAYQSCPYTADPTVAANWSAPVAIIGQGVGGYAGTPQHSWVLVDGQNLYCYFCDVNNQYGWCASANINAPTVWTTLGTQTSLLPGLHTNNGNFCVVKYNGLYYMWLDCVENVLGYQVYQIALCTCTSPTGPFNVIINPLTSLAFPTSGQPTGGAVPGGPFVQYEAATGYFVYYGHGGSWGAGYYPNNMYRLYCTPANLGTDNWIPLDGGYPFMVCAGAYEIDQIADPFLIQGPTGTQYLFYEGGNNRNGLFQLSVVALVPKLMQKSGPNWIPAEAGFDPNPVFISPYLNWNFSFNAAAFPLGTGAYSAPINVGTWVLDTTAANDYLFNALSYNSSAAQNDFIGFDCQPAPGYWTMELVVHTGPNQGIITVGFNGGSGQTPPGGMIYDLPIGPTNVIDCYSPTDVYNVRFSITNIQIGGITTARRRIILQVATKNASSGGYGLGWHSITMFRTSDYCPIFPI